MEIIKRQLVFQREKKNKKTVFRLSILAPCPDARYLRKSYTKKKKKGFSQTINLSRIPYSPRTHTHTPRGIEQIIICMLLRARGHFNSSHSLSLSAQQHGMNVIAFAIKKHKNTLIQLIKEGMEGELCVILIQT